MVLTRPGERSFSMSIVTNYSQSSSSIPSGNWACLLSERKKPFFYSRTLTLASCFPESFAPGSSSAEFWEPYHSSSSLEIMAVQERGVATSAVTATRVLYMMSAWNLLEYILWIRVLTMESELSWVSLGGVGVVFPTHLHSQPRFFTDSNDRSSSERPEGRSSR